MDRPSYWQILRDYPNPIRQAIQYWLTSDLPLRERPEYIEPWCHACGSPITHQPRLEDDGTYTDMWRCTSQWRCKNIIYFDISTDRWKELMMGWLDPDSD